MDIEERFKNFKVVFRENREDFDMICKLAKSGIIDSSIANSFFNISLVEIERINEFIRKEHEEYEAE